MRNLRMSFSLMTILLGLIFTAPKANSFTLLTNSSGVGASIAFFGIDCFDCTREQWFSALFVLFLLDSETVEIKLTEIDVDQGIKDGMDLQMIETFNGNLDELEMAIYSTSLKMKKESTRQDFVEELNKQKIYVGDAAIEALIYVVEYKSDQI